MSMEALMKLKRILLPFSLLAISSAIFAAQAAYVPTRGPLALADAAQPGVITSTLLHNRELATERAKILRFLNLGPNAPVPAYQDIIDRVRPTQAPEALEVLQAYANVVMYIYQEKAYLLKAGFLPHVCPIRGIRSPLSKNNELDQLIQEYDQLASIALEKMLLWEHA